MMVFLLGVSGAVVACQPAPEAEEPAPAQPAGNDTAGTGDGEWTVLFDGSSIDGWNMIGDAAWMLDPTDDSVMASMGSGFLVTPESYRDFELEVEFWVDEPANSGVFIRCSDPMTINDQNAYEVNIFDTRPDQTYRTGSLVNFSPPTEVIDAAGQWNTFRIRAEGAHVTVDFNGVRTVDIEDDTYTEGPVGLQYGAGSVKFRNVRIRPL
jgi:hypothetical protein